MIRMCYQNMYVPVKVNTTTCTLTLYKLFVFIDIGYRTNTR